MILLELNGEVGSLAYWAQKIGISRDALYKRLTNHNWDVARVLATPRGRLTPRVSRLGIGRVYSTDVPVLREPPLKLPHQDQQEEDSATREGTLAGALSESRVSP